MGTHKNSCNNSEEVQDLIKKPQDSLKELPNLESAYKYSELKLSDLKPLKGFDKK